MGAKSKKKRSTLDQLNKYAESYKRKKKSFRKRLKTLKDQFNLKPEQEREVDFGIIIPADRSLRKYTDILNADKELNKLSDQINDIILKGCVVIFKDIISSGKYIPGYELEEFIKDPDENTDEIINLMQGFGGAKHIHTVKGKITLEIPARRYINKNKDLMKIINFWLKTVKEFSIW